MAEITKADYDGTNIVGGPFKSYVDEQISVRQDILGKSNKNNEDIVWENGKSAFVALASSVNIANSFTPQVVKNDFNASIDPGGEDTTDLRGSSYVTSQKEIDYYFEELGEGSQNIIYTENNDGEERIQQLELPKLSGDPQQFFGNFLSRNVVLYGGTAYYDSSGEEGTSNNLSGPNYRSGIPSDNNFFNKSAYGFGGTDEGLRPMPGITSFNLKSKNMGSLRDATVTIKANSQEQFKMIDNLYCRIGYTMFLEWGNSLYFDNNGTYQNYNSRTSLIPLFLQGKEIVDGVEVDYLTEPTKFISKIENFREEINGNYDAFFGRVKNFSWQFNPKDNSYEITLSLISWGDIIESLTIDGQYGTINNSETLENPNDTSALLSFLSIAATPSGKKTLAILGSRLNVEYDNFKRTLIPNLEIIDPGSGDNTTQEASDNITSLNYERLVTSVGKIVSGHAQFADKHYYYIRFGDILDFIKDRLLLYSPSSKTPIIDINTDTLKNICYAPGINVSADPSKVMVNNPIPYGFDLEFLTQKGFKKDGSGNILEPTDGDVDWEHQIYQDSIFRLKGVAELENFNNKFNPDGSGADFPLHGKIMNIYFEYQYLLDTIKDLRDEDTKISLFDFTDKLLKTANSCLGGVNKLSIRLEDDRVMRIYDQTPIYGTQYLNKEETTINLTGIIPKFGNIANQGSFVTDVNIKTELTNDFSTTVSIGAQAQSQTLGEDATGLSKWNFGLVDRFYTQKLDAFQKDNNTSKPTHEERIEKIREQLKYLWFGYAEGSKAKGKSVGDSKDTDKNDDANNFLTRIFTKDNKTSSKNIYIFNHFPIERISDFVKLQKDWLAELIKHDNILSNAKLKSEGSETFGTNQIGMIPMNVSVTMDGLSGIRIYDKLKLDTRFLPNYYPQTLYWIIKGVSHEVVNNKWSTKLETIAVPKLANSQNLNGLLAVSSIVSPLDGLKGTNSNPYSPSTLPPIPGSPILAEVLKNAGYQSDTAEYQIALTIGTKEGWNSLANDGIGTRSYRNNNPGNLDIDSKIRIIDPNAELETNPFSDDNRFAKFSTAEKGAEALVETKIKRWATGDMPVTRGNQSLIEGAGGQKWTSGTQPTFEQFMYTYAPPNENNTEGYLGTILSNLQAAYPGNTITRDSVVNDVIYMSRPL